jgi:5'-phosphate synthase pdxT subunit
MVVGVLAVQGAFIEHERAMEKLGVSCIELRNSKDLEKHYDALIFPGGESTVQGKLLRESGMYDIIKKQIENGMPVLATCAGMILLASKIEDDNTKHLATMPVTVKRNAYGRQLGSFHTTDYVKGIGQVPMTFIRAPYISQVDGNVDVLAKVDGKIVGVRYNNQLAFAFHPELDDNLSIHKMFLESVLKVKGESIAC